MQRNCNKKCVAKLCVAHCLRYYELTLYFDTFNREIVGFGLTDRKGNIKPYFEGLKQVIELIKEKEQTNLSTLHTDWISIATGIFYIN